MKPETNSGRRASSKRRSTNGRVCCPCFSSWKQTKGSGRLPEAIRYLDYHPEFSTYPGGNSLLSEDSNTPEDEGEVKTRRGFQELLSALLLNSALAAIKLAGPINLRTAISLTNRAVTFALSDADRGRRSKLGAEISDNDDLLS